MSILLETDTFLSTLKKLVLHQDNIPLLRDFFFSDSVSDNKIMLLMMYWKTDYKMVNLPCNCSTGSLTSSKKPLCMYCWIWKLISSLYFFTARKVNTLNASLERICVVWIATFEKTKSDNAFPLVIALSCSKISPMHPYKLKPLHSTPEPTSKPLSDYIWQGTLV